MSVGQHSVPELAERQRRVRDHQRRDFVGPQALKVERIGPYPAPNTTTMQRAIARPFRPSRRPVWSSHPYLLCRTFILVAGPDAATFPEADSLVPAVAPPRILPQSSASKKPAQIITRPFRFATALSDCGPFALSQLATTVSEPDTPNRQGSASVIIRPSSRADGPGLRIVCG
jgi:hypothetical protein